MLASNFRSGGGSTRANSRNGHVGGAGDSGRRRWRAVDAIAFSSGMAAASAIVYALAPKIVVIPTFSYLGVRSLLGEYQAQGHLELRSGRHHRYGTGGGRDGRGRCGLGRDPDEPDARCCRPAGDRLRRQRRRGPDGRRLDVRNAAPAEAAPRRRGRGAFTAEPSSSAGTATC